MSCSYCTDSFKSDSITPTSSSGPCRPLLRNGHRTLPNVSPSHPRGPPLLKHPHPQPHTPAPLSTWALSGELRLPRFAHVAPSAWNALPPCSRCHRCPTPTPSSIRQVFSQPSRSISQAFLGKSAMLVIVVHASFSSYYSLMCKQYMYFENRTYWKAKKYLSKVTYFPPTEKALLSLLPCFPSTGPTPASLSQVPSLTVRAGTGTRAKILTTTECIIKASPNFSNLILKRNRHLYYL